MTALRDIILAAVQGLTEFLPVSSSGHLVLVPYFLRWPEPTLGFAVALHLGTLLAVVVYFWRDVVAIFSKAFRNQPAKAPTEAATGDEAIGRSTLWMIILATLPAAIMGVALEHKVKALFEAPLGVAGFLLLTAALLIVSERFASNRCPTGSMRWWQALLIGFAQGCAIAPGLSRSGATIAAGLLLGFKRTQAARFAFLLSIPAILGAGVWELRKVEGFSPLWLLAIAVSAVFGYLAIKWALRAVAKAKLWHFALYCLLLAAVTFALHFLHY